MQNKCLVIMAGMIFFILLTSVILLLRYEMFLKVHKLLDLDANSK